MKYLILQVTHETKLPSISLVDKDDVDSVVGLHESSFTDFPDEDGVRHLQDNQYDYFIASTMYYVEVMAIVDREILEHEAFFDDLNDPANPDDDEMYQAVGNELDEWIVVKNQIVSWKW